MAQRVPLKTHQSAVKVAARVRNNPSEPTSGIRTTGISLPSDVYDLLTDVAFKRKKKRSDGASVSAILLEAVAQMRDRLEAERRG
jgi:hypothetical protein